MPSVLSNLAPALLQTFLTIAVGYLFGRLRWIPAEGIRAMGMFVTTLALPALLLRSMILIDFSHVDWTFFLSIFISKSILFVCTAIICILRYGWRDRAGYSDAGCFAIFVTQSNDFAMGLPILTALFGGDPATASFPELLYLLAPISLAILNPIAFFLMEVGRKTPEEIKNEKQKSIDKEGKAPVLEEATTNGNASGSNSAYCPPSTAPVVPSQIASSPLTSSSLLSPAPPSLLSPPHYLADGRFGSFGEHSDDSAYNSDDGGFDDDGHSSSLRMHVSPDGQGFSLAKRHEINNRSQSSRTREQTRRGNKESSTNPNDVALMYSISAPLKHLSPSPITVPSASSTVPFPTASHSSDSALANASIFSRLRMIVWKVLTNPIVFCSMFGIVFNFALSNKVPKLVDGFLLALGNTFSALALFVLGVNMNGKLELFHDRRKLSTPLILIIAKSLALPVIIRLVIVGLGVSGTQPITLCAFLIGTFPTAPSVHFFAVDCGARNVELVAPSMVLGTFIAAPIMFVSAQMVTIALTSDEINTIVSDSTRIAAGFGFIAAVWCVSVLLYNNRWNHTRHKLLIVMCTMQALYTLSVQMCKTEMTGLSADFRFRAVLGGQFGVYIWVGLMSINEIIRSRLRDSNAESRYFKWYMIFGLILLVVLIGIIEIFGYHPDPIADLPFYACWNRYGIVQWWVVMITMGITLLTIIGGLVNLRADDLPFDIKDKSFNPFEPSAPIDMDLTQSLLIDQKNGVNRGSSTSGSSNSVVGLSSSVPSSSSSVVTSNLPSSTMTNGTSADVNTHSSALVAADSASATTSINIRPAASSNLPSRPSSPSLRFPLPSASALESFWLFAMRVFLLLMASSVFLSMALDIWSSDKNGTRVEMQLLDAVLFGTAAIYTYALFAATNTMESPLKPITRGIRKMCKSAVC